MAGDWVKFEIDTFEKPEVINMAEDLGLPEEHIAGCLLKVWCWFDKQSRNGHVNSVTEKYIDRVTCVTGFAQAMREVGWLICSDDGLSLPNFDRHNGKSAKSRALAADRKRKERSRNERDKNVTREEKEKNIKTNKKSDSSVPPCPHSEIIKLYHNILPDHQGVVEELWKDSQRAKDLQTRWRQSTKHQSLEFWRWFFETVKTNPHWMGENDRGWKPNLEWLIKKANFIKVVERGVSEQRRAAS